MIRRLLLTAFAALTMLVPASSMAAGISYPEAPGPSPDKLIEPPMANPYFYMRPDGQAFQLQLDTSCNLADYLNRHYYDFKWRAQVWSPYDNCTQVEKTARLMNTYPSWREANNFRLWTGFNEAMERKSGFGP